MEFTNNNDVLIQLNLKDRRGRKVRVAEVKDLKVRVWTNNPDCAITFDHRDILQKRDDDTLVIKGYQMESLASGVITYSYRCRIEEVDHGHLHSTDLSEVIVTDIFWRNKFNELVIDNPTYYHSLERLKDLVDFERKDRIKQVKDLERYINEGYTNKLNDEIDRATYAEEKLENSINEVKETLENSINEVKEASDAKYDELNSRLAGEIERSNQVDIEMFKYIKEVEEKTAGNKAETEGKLEEADQRAQEAEKELQSYLDAEKARAKAEESRIEEKLDAEIARSKAEDTQTNLDLNAEVTRAKGEEARIEALVEAEKARAKDAEEKLKAAIDDEVSRSKAADEKTAKKQEELQESFSELKNTVQDEIRRSQQFDEDCEKMCKKAGEDVEALKTALDDEVARAKKKENNIKKAVENEVSRATIKENELEAATNLLETKVDANAENIKSETSRAQVVEKDLADSLQALKQTVLSKDQSYNDQFQDILNKLNAEENARQIKDEDLQRLIDILNADEFTVGSVAHSIKDAEHRIDDVLDELKHEIDEIIGGNLEDYATKEYVDNRFEKLVGAAPEALDTLEEIAERLQKDDDLHKALQELLSKKANKEDVYTKSEVDAFTGDLQNSINAEAQRAQLAEDGLQTQITTNLGEITTIKDKVQANTEAIQEEATRAKTAEQSLNGTLTNLSNDYELFKDKVNQHIASGDANYAEVANGLLQETNRATAAEEALQSSLNQTKSDLTTLQEKVNTHLSEAEDNYTEVKRGLTEEVTRATNVETQLQNQIDVINGDENTIGSIEHAIADAKHYTDDEIEKLSHIVETAEDNLAAHVDQSNQKFEELTNALAQKDQEVADLTKRLETLEAMLTWAVY